QCDTTASPDSGNARGSPNLCAAVADRFRQRRRADYLFGAGRTALTSRYLRLVELSRIVDEVEGTLGSFLDGDYEADAVRSAAGERRAGVFDGDRIHVPAVLVRAYVHHASLDGGHLVRVGRIGDRQGDAGIAAHVFGLPDRVGGAHEDVVILQSDTHDPVARRSVRAEGRRVHVIGRVEKLSDITGNRNRHCSQLLGHIRWRDRACGTVG